MANRTDDPPAENERAAATAIANGSQEMPLAGQRDDSWQHIADAIPHRHIVAFAAMTEELRAVRRGDGDAVHRLAETLGETLGPTECRALRDAAELARRTLPPAGWKMADWLRVMREARA